MAEASSSAGTKGLKVPSAILKKNCGGCPSDLQQYNNNLDHNKLGKLPTASGDVPLVATNKPTCKIPCNFFY
jgi:hypothetical protein